MITEAVDQQTKVKVHFFDSNKPQQVSTPEPTFGSDEYLGMSQTEDSAILGYNRQLSEGSDNPFRPDGDISKEADEIVQMIKSGVSLDSSVKLNSTPSPTPIEANNKHDDVPKNSITEVDGVNNKQTIIEVREEKNNVKSVAPGPVDIKHEKIMPAQQPGQAEHVVIKKKKKCVIQ